jgi:hypothetical protein
MTLGVKAEIEKKLFNLPQVLIIAELYGLILGPRVKKGYHQIWEANWEPLGPIYNPKMLKVGPELFWP